jgi:hypothetical protein
MRFRQFLKMVESPDHNTGCDADLLGKSGNEVSAKVAASSPLQQALKIIGRDEEIFGEVICRFLTRVVVVTRDQSGSLLS